MNYQDVVNAALARLTDWPTNVMAQSVMFRRVGVRQAEVFAAAARWDAEFFSTQAIGTLDGGAIDLDLLVTSGLAPCEAVIRVLIEDKGTSSYTNGQKVNLVTVQDIGAGEAPRMRLLDNVLRGVGTDMNGVTSIRLFYAYRSKVPAASESGSTAIELPEPFEELLVIDLARYVAQRTPQADQEKKVALVGLLDAEEKELLGLLEMRVKTYNRDLQLRHTRAGSAAAV